MPSTSKSQRRLFGWALACKRDKNKKCPKSVRELADSMTEKELEDYAKTSEKDLPEKVKEAIENAYVIALELSEAEATLEGLEIFESSDILSESEEADKKANEEADKKVKEEADKKEADKKEADKKAKEEADNKAKEEADKKSTPEKKDDTKDLPKAKVEPAMDKISGGNEKMSPSVDNMGWEMTDVTPPPVPGYEKADKDVNKNVFTPNVHKFPMGKGKNQRKVYTFEEFLKMINYRTHDDVLQKGG